MRKNNRKPIERCRKKLPQFTTMNVIDGQSGLVIYSSLIFYSLTIDNILNIVVLLILAGVSINLVLGNNGIIAKAKDSQVKTENAQIFEHMQFKVFDYQAEGINKENTDKIIDKLKQDQYINEDKTINVNKLMQSSLKTGKGSLANGDVYVLEQDTEGSNKYSLVYYNKEKEKTNIGQLFEEIETQLLEPTPEEYFIYDDATQAIALKDPNSYYSSSNKAYIGLETIVIPSTYKGKIVKKIGFYDAEKKQIRGIMNVADVKTIIVSEGIEVLSEYSFRASSMKNIKLPESLTSIANDVFSYCTSLTNITIPNKVTSMGGYVFESCDLLETITIPFKDESSIPQTWDTYWKYGCNDKVIYSGQI